MGFLLSRRYRVRDQSRVDVVDRGDDWRPDEERRRRRRRRRGRARGVWRRRVRNARRDFNPLTLGRVTGWTHRFTIDWTSTMCFRSIALGIRFSKGHIPDT